MRPCESLAEVTRTVGQVGILERENATILNASILSFARRTVAGFKRAMTRLHLGCPLFLTQNDGTLTGASMAAKLPIRTFARWAHLLVDAVLSLIDVAADRQTRCGERHFWPDSTLDRKRTDGLASSSTLAGQRQTSESSFRAASPAKLQPVSSLHPAKDSR